MKSNLLIFLLLLPFTGLSATHTPERPNILVIYVDDLGCFSFHTAPYPEDSAYAGAPTFAIQELFLRQQPNPTQ